MFLSPFYLPKEDVNVVPEEDEEELESGTIEREVFEQWSRDQADLLYDQSDGEF